jgi:hypothetical protein
MDVAADCASRRLLTTCTESEPCKAESKNTLLSFATTATTPNDLGAMLPTHAGHRQSVPGAGRQCREPAERGRNRPERAGHRQGLVETGKRRRSPAKPPGNRHVRRGKGGRDRVVPLSKIACRFIAQYIRLVRPLFLNGIPTEILFLSNQSRQLGATTVSEIIRLTAKNGGIRSHVTCHLWRHTCATHMIQNGANLRHIQEMLGHHKLETTQRYLHMTIMDLKQAHHQFHPRESDVARRSKNRQNAPCNDAETAISKGSPASAENRHILSQPESANISSSKELPIAWEPCI